MNELLDMKKAKLMAAGIALSFLAIHVVMFFLFRYYGVTPMVRFNVFSILFYLVSLVMVHKEKLRLYTVTVYLEVVAHMTAAVLCVGTGAGFQVTLVGINILAFYADYIGCTLSLPRVPTLKLSIIGTCGYLFGFAFNRIHSPAYVLPENANYWLQILWGIITFSITIVFLQLFVYLTFNSEQLLAKRMSHDKLTGLPNRYHMSNFLGNAVEKEYLPAYWAAMADIDNFKSVNDTYGHNCGDYVLQTVAELIRDGMEGVELCRWGGEEFLMVGKVQGDLHEQIARLERLRRTVEEHRFWYEEKKLSVTITIGMARYEEGQSINEWINVADQKLYEGKCSGKNKVVV